MPNHMLRSSTGLLALAFCLSIAGSLSAPSWAQPTKPKSSADALQDEPDEQGQESAPAGKKVKTEGQKTEGQKTEGDKTKAKPADQDDEDSRPGKPGTPGPAAPPRDR